MSQNPPESLPDTLSGIEALMRELVLPDKALIDGAWVEGEGRRRFTHLSPRDGKPLVRLAALDSGDIDRAVRSARTAFEDKRWRGLAPKVRKKILHRLADLMESDAAILAMLETMDTGKPISESKNVDIPLSIECVRYYAEALDKITGEVVNTPGTRFAYMQPEPLGVIGAIVPWNFPLQMAVWKVAPALAMGNSVVLKPSEMSSSTALFLGQLALEAGVPEGVFNVVTGLGHEAGQARSHHEDVDMIAFTGSGVVGRLLMKASADSNLKRVSLELGGKSPQIVFADCPDMETAAKQAAWGIFYNQGQVCTAASRLLVEASVKDEFLARVLDVTKAIMVGDPYDPKTALGALISEKQMHAVLGHIDRAEAEGARLVCGGGRLREDTGGYYLSPTIFDVVTPEMSLAQDEVFGPVLAVQTFEDETEALRLANGTVYGLASGVWTKDLSRAHRMITGIKAGLVWVNGWDSCDMTSAFGGVKQSGFGRDRSMHALHKYADIKSVSITTG